MGTPKTVGPGKTGIVLVSDHASNLVPEGLDLGVPPGTMDMHIAVDIGVEGVAERMARRHAIPAHLACVSRLVIDLHREEDHPNLIPMESDGVLVPGNIGADRAERLAKFYHPYHDAMADWLDEADPRLIVSLHSFTPQLETQPDENRPWEVALLYNQNAEPARHAIRLFAAQGLTVGDNQPYSGRELNATMNRHAEAKGRDYLAIEVRNDLIATEAGQARWAALIADVAQRTVLALDAK
ncbi:N-formylglutamate amidohydrolase [Croceicoccus naphthovorans]|uniref:N-formylglutamate amidohydrolase n=1 Tax=Croceicoccus naphthovorans TaxID=1348774 RepID=A0A0G3XKL8_9SPHN|nr:N-formylglutamate amidohydrolase [Croceicoccus naphthovorans]